jgi:acyl carrier protein
LEITLGNDQKAVEMVDSHTQVIRSTLESIWCDVLERHSAKGDDNFFRLGGDSLAMMKIIFRLKAELGIDLELDAIFDTPSFDDLCARVAKSSTV